jgi:hypothetical protein
MDLIIKALQDTSTFDRVLKDSYRHNNGFHKLVMDELPDGTKIRLHLYDGSHSHTASPPPPKEHIHDHRWAFTSTILAGQLHMDRFEWCEPGDDGGARDSYYDAYQYCADKSTGRFGLMSLGKRRLRFVEECVFHQGESYSMAPEELHRIHGQPLLGATTITLMATAPPVSSTCHLFADPTQGHQIPTPHTQIITPYHPHELVALLRRMQQIIARAQNDRTSPN